MGCLQDFFNYYGKKQKNGIKIEAKISMYCYKLYVKDM